ncbi:RnfABCDGE type electron transport complex subunit D [Limimaricola pyoseonensis]|uniref:NQR2, RnfD, RnfE family n=1 Tax=Limimaricola pyoseonensis TaxID=521013 RepID=A0A1G7JMD4_9RHOB|nr:RnfABCDGE type electron transport complex subunit D [Limimaricola pyoseonensis]SDF26015.1 NQR2, RnfD, RnfE family [Limimaricola pyoseonensis]
MTYAAPLALRRHAARFELRLRLAALLPPVAVRLAVEPGAAAALLVAVTVALGCDLVFAELRRRPVRGSGLVAALILALLAPAEAGLGEITVAMALAVVLGELVFGGVGFGFVSTGALALGILSLSFPHLAPVAPPPPALWAALPGAALLLWCGLAAMPVVLGMGVGVAVAGAVAGWPGWPAAAVLAFGAVFLAADPFGGPVTALARWLFGAAVGALALLLAPAQGAVAPALVFAVLFGNVAAPLADAAVLAVDDLRRGGRHG